MVEITEGTQVTLSQILGGGLTFKGKPLKWEKVGDDANASYQAKTNLTDEEIAAGNNDFIFGFSLPHLTGTIGVAMVPITDEEREKIAEKVRKAKEEGNKDGGGANFKPQAMGRADAFIAGDETMTPPLLNSRGEPAGDPDTGEESSGRGSTKDTTNKPTSHGGTATEGDVGGAGAGNKAKITVK